MSEAHVINMTNEAYERSEGSRSDATSSTAYSTDDSNSINDSHSSRELVEEQRLLLADHKTLEDEEDAKVPPSDSDSDNESSSYNCSSTEGHDSEISTILAHAAPVGEENNNARSTTRKGYGYALMKLAMADSVDSNMNCVDEMARS